MHISGSKTTLFDLTLTSPWGRLFVITNTLFFFFHKFISFEKSILFYHKIIVFLRHIPYFACACFICSEKGKLDVPENVLGFTGNDYIVQMIECAADNVREFGIKNIELVAHDGGAYDFHYFLTSMYNPSIINKIMMRNNKFIIFVFKHQNVIFYVKDLLISLLRSLSSAAKSSLNEHDGKTNFHIIR